MAAITISTIGIGSTAKIEKVKFAEAASIGAAVYKSTADNGSWRNADSNASVQAAGQDGIGILLTTVLAADEWGVIATSGKVLMQSSVQRVKGTTYVVGATAGQINPDSDSASGWYKTILGVGGTLGAATTDFDEFLMDPYVSNQAIA